MTNTPKAAPGRAKDWKALRHELDERSKLGDGNSVMLTIDEWMYVRSLASGGADALLSLTAAENDRTSGRVEVTDSQRYQWVRSRQGRGRLFETPRVSIEFSSETPKGADRAPIRAPMDAELDAAIDSQIAAERARTAATRGGEES